MFEILVIENHKKGLFLSKFCPQFCMKKGGKFDEKSLQRGSLKELVTHKVTNFCVELWLGLRS